MSQNEFLSTMRSALSGKVPANIIEENIRYYDEDDYFYNKREIDTGERATLPSGFQHYGYTKQFQDGAGTDTETERGISNEINSGKYQERGNAEYL